MNALTMVDLGDARFETRQPGIPEELDNLSVVGVRQLV
jgi:hypothetical protein